MCINFFVFVIWLQGTSSQPRKGGLAGSSGVRRRRREPVGSQVRQLEMDIKLIWGIKCWGKFAQVYRGSSRASPTGSGSRRETDTVTDPVPGKVWLLVGCVFYTESRTRGSHRGGFYLIPVFYGWK